MKNESSPLRDKIACYSFNAQSNLWEIVIGIYSKTVVATRATFENRQDVAHIQRAFEFLKPGGRLVAIASSTSGARLDSWAGDHGGYIEPMELGAFKTSERPTGVNCAWVIAEK